MKYATVIIDISHEKVDRGFSYYVPEELSDRIVIGSPVVVPFGRGDTKRTGYVIALSEEAPAGVAPDRIKPVMGLMKGALPIEAQLVALAAWMRAHYGSTMTRALRTVIPIRKKEAPKERKVISSIVSTDRLEDEYTALVSKKRYSKAKERLLSELKRNPGTGLPWELVTGKLMVPSTSIRELERAGIISVDARRSYRNPIDVVLRADTAEDPDKIILNPAQKQVLSEFHRGREEDDRPFLLYGITGSGKTEVYIEMLREVIAEGKQAIVLIPEIALTYQTVMRFYSRFGERVSFLNSRMSPGERYDQYERAKRGELDIMVGPRSALFTAFDNLGLIIIDEEHETSYQSEQPPRYHAREVAEERARLTGATLVLGSATPSLESYSRALEGRYRLLRLTERAVVGATLPTTEIVDLRAELKGGNRSILSRKLQEAIGDRLSRGEQSMLFLNRRGVSGFISCRACGEAIKCPHCDVSLSEHRDGRLHCHYCGYTAPKPGVCPSCGSKHIAGFRVGTEKVEEEVKRLFPKARVLRMDADTTGGKDGHREILSAFSDHEADILVGTQMIVKGHDFGNVTLMGILAADQALNDYDFRSSERCYDLLVQASGRAGRGERPGLVIIQTYKPEHYAITAAAASDYEG
ncbi:MAG: primosomal protein N', partial [Lachnospiraceae bacterium]|nr:primosomal protein N' [Lachnospiraceae bacterium]